MGDSIGSGIPALQLAMSEYLRNFQFRALAELLVAIVLFVVIPAILLALTIVRFKKDKAVRLGLIGVTILSMGCGGYVFWNRQNHTLQFDKYVRLYMNANDEEMRKLMDINAKSVDLLGRLQQYLPAAEGK